MFINLPVRDVEASTAFFTALGFAFDPVFASPDSACMRINDTAFVMLLSRSRFADFTEGAPAHDPRSAIAALYTVSAESREQVDALVAGAVAAGGASHGAPEDHGFMYGHGFTDLDGHGWGVMWMNTQAAADSLAAANG